MIKLSIRRKIMSIAVTLIVLMAVTAILSMLSVMQVSARLEELTNSYIPAYGNLARANIRSVERSLELRRMVIERIRSPFGSERLTAIRGMFETKGAEVESEAEAARALINGLIQKGVTFSDPTALARLDSRLEAALNVSRRHLNSEIERMLPLLETGDTKAIDDGLGRVDVLRNELNGSLDSIRTDMFTLLRSEADQTRHKQSQVTIIAAVLTVLAAILGLVFSMLVSAGMTRPVRKLLESARAVEAGHLEEKLPVTTEDEIGQLTTAFNSMVEQLRLKERIRETFGKYIDPRVVEGLIDRPALASEGERRVMTVLFCDVKGFSSTSRGTTPQGLVKVMNRYLSMMSAPVRQHDGIIDKYIGDAIMAYWGPPFTADADQARLASIAALDMIEIVPRLNAELPELLGVRSLPVPFDIRIGIATGEALVGSIGSELMMSYTVMGDTVNLASRLESANKVYGSRILVSEATVASAAADIEAREIDRIVTVGQTQPQTVFEIMGRKGELTAAQSALRDHHVDGLAAYRARRWDDARRAFTAALDAVPGDGPSMTFIKRLDSFVASPPGDDWDGVWRLEQK
jgi:adenylate cyclase